MISNHTGTTAEAAPLPPGWMRPMSGRPDAPGIGALMSARAGGVSKGRYAHCNLGDHVGDEPSAVARNRQAFASLLGAAPMWLDQVHGNRLVRLSRAPGRSAGMSDTVNPETAGIAPPRADGAFTTEPGLACVVMVADCLPLLLCAPEGRGVAALHAGWRGLAGAGPMKGHGIVHAGVQALCEATSTEPAALKAWIGPCIGPGRFEVGADVLSGFGVAPGPGTPHPRFTPLPLQAAPGSADVQGARSLPFFQPKWLADLPSLAADALVALGVQDIAGGTWCTVSDASRFFSFRRDGSTGRQAAAIFIR